MNLSPQQKLLMMRQFRIDPGVAFLNAVLMLQDMINSSMQAIVDERIDLLEASLPEKVMLKHVQMLKGDKGDSVDPEEVIQAVTPTAVKSAEKAAVEYVKKVIKQPENGITPSDDQLLALITPLARKGDDGHTPTRGELLDLIRPLIPVIEDMRPSEDELRMLIEDMMPKQEGAPPQITIEELFSMIERASPTFTIDASRIRNLPRQKKEKGTQGKYHAAHGGGSGSSSTPTASTTTVDGSTTVFAVSSRPVKVYADNSIFFEQLTPGDGGGYTYSAGFITLFFPPQNYVKYE